MSETKKTVERDLCVLAGHMKQQATDYWRIVNTSSGEPTESELALSRFLAIRANDMACLLSIVYDNPAYYPAFSVGEFELGAKTELKGEA